MSLEVNKIYCVDCLEGLKKLDDDSIDSIVTDPPYGLGFMGKEWDTYDKTQFGLQGNEGENDLKNKKNFKVLPRYRSDNSFYEFSYAWSKEVLRVLKPGGYLLSFGGTRTYHRMACAIEDAGFEIRDQIQWLYGSGFPKNMNIGKALQKQNINNKEYNKLGTALKPANEPICLARKPLSEKTVAQNVLKWGTGGINIDDCRIETDEIRKDRVTPKENLNWSPSKKTRVGGRYPSNVILDEEVGRMLDDQNKVSKNNSKPRLRKSKGGRSNLLNNNPEVYSSKGGVSRFFYCAKVSKKERNQGLDGFEEKQYSYDGRHKEIENAYQRNKSVAQNNHPTVKPVKLMEYLVRLVTPKKGIVLDPFMGSGTTGMAAKSQGFNYIGFDKTAEYCKIAEARIKSVEVQKKLVE